MDVGLNAPNDDLNPTEFSAPNLPKNIQDVLNRRSSRDPNCRFSKKLHALLSYVTANPEKEEELGLSWVNDDIFQVDKKKLLKVMKIKLNTLNVNFKNLNFIQLHCDRQGWTRWRKDGFTQRGLTGEKDSAPKLQSMNDNVANETDFFEVPHQPEEKIELKLGHMNSDHIDVLTEHINQEWQEIVGSNNGRNMKSTNANFFINTLAKRYKLPEQNFDNAFEVLNSILAPSGTDTIKFCDFYRFMSMFGPAKSVMLKIHSLLEVAQTPFPWLYFGTIPDSDVQQVFGYFNEQEPNCLVIHDKKGNYDYAWNLPLASSSEEYVVDSLNNKFSSWESYFQAHPITDGDRYDERELNTFVA